MHFLIALAVLVALVYLISKMLQSRGAANRDASDAMPGHAGTDVAGLEVAFISGGKLFYKARNGDVGQIHSPYIQEIADRSERQKERHAWKQNTSFEISAFGGRKQFEPDGVRIVMASAQFDGNKSLVYCLKDEGFGGLFAYDLESRLEQRLLHKQHLSLGDLNLDPVRGKILCTSSSKSGIANIAMLNSDGSSFRELTGGDTFDSSPAWIPGEDDEILYQSAGLARGPDGYLIAQGHATIQLLNMQSGSVTPIMDDARYDFLQPRVCARGNLHFIRRPFETPKYGPDKLLIDTLLFPFRLLRAIFHYLNFFSLMYSRKPLTGATGPAVKADLKDIVLKGKRIDAEKALRSGMKINGVPSLVPSSWQLVRRTPRGDESVLASHVASYDMTPEGKIVYSNGSGVFLLDAEGQSTLILKFDLVDDVIVRGPAPQTIAATELQA
ncbi:hypothetical protein [Janthinobacterium sp. 17J80-10]|uniref:hypothetical protein n=1 Tax=Janthinobacterium sp. 17J80-10 TaxID=2497863 RepID=UPI0010059E39|nr:hypothetical protein [Janthinobacterium sp. 17J80-10]QAU33719.1 hypothetical protein EKL02_05700 [Janthinobacterium sp. 17J80-10]